MNRLTPLPFQAVREILVQWGFVYKSTKGSHFKYENKKAGRTVIVPSHAKRDIPVSTIQGIIKQSGLSRDLFIK